MPKREAKLLIEDIKSSIAKIERYTSGMDRERFLSDEMTIDAVVRNLEIIGEACRQMPDSFKNIHTSIAWHQIAGLRNRIVHDYFGIDMELIWQIISVEIPSLKKAISVLD